MNTIKGINKWNNYNRIYEHKNRNSSEETIIQIAFLEGFSAIDY